MPFTPSHAVVALPFVRTPLIAPAIAVGAMAPDLPLFVRGTPLTYDATHTNVVVGALVALVLYAGWYLLLRPAVRELSPTWLARRLPEEWDAGAVATWNGIRAPRPGARHAVWRALYPLTLAISLMLGVISHIAWDAFTHEGRAGVGLVPALDEQWGPLLGYKWLQYGSGVLGLVVLAIAGAVWLAGREAAASVDRLIAPAVRVLWWGALPLALIAAWVIGLAVYGPLTAVWTPAHLAYRVLPPAVAVWGMATLALCVAVVVRRRRRG
ncbi:DUF4184 family protein [Microbacterium fluvii]|uniref:DUF4184 family protein n=1 Tax=Microbacterium fluvii TaxID=415215 RepID=A0ABW2HJ99_9MICO|nr:DUF4184 family protein [Microbacterium fluvii]MCU4673545.1 DUF4184 family protein [Microbacterium fluvii]